MWDVSEVSSLAVALFFCWLLLRRHRRLLSLLARLVRRG